MQLENININYFDSKPIGHGIMKISNDAIYEGPITKTPISGFGKIYFTNGDVFQGNINDSSMTNGILIKSNGYRFTGVFRNNKLVGKVTIQDNLKNIFEGNFTNGQLDDSNVKIQYSNGERYEGSIRNYKKNGMGTLTKSGNKIIKGLWNNDVFVEDSLADSTKLKKKYLKYKTKYQELKKSQ